MKQKDKILINAYFDSETSEEETGYIEKLIKNDLDARNYFEKIKVLDLEYSYLSKSEDAKRLVKSAENFIQQNTNQKKVNSPFFEFNFMKPILTYTFTAALFFSIGTQIVQDDFKESDKEFKLITMRSNEALRQQVKIILSEMVEKKLSSAQIISENYNKILISNEIQTGCYMFEIIGDNLIIGKYCVETDELFFSNIN